MSEAKCQICRSEFEGGDPKYRLTRRGEILADVFAFASLAAFAGLVAYVIAVWFGVVDCG